MNFPKLKRLFLRTLIGCLIAAAGLAVVTVLIGKFNDICAKALFTILLVAVHSLVSFGLMSNNEKQDTFGTLTFFTNATFGIIVLSFATAVLGVWDVMPGELVARLYGLYMVLLFAVLHGEVLAKTLGKQLNIDKTVRINFGFMVVVVAMLLPIIFGASFGPFYYRMLAAAGIIDATLTLITVILYKLYMQKHPKLPDPVFSVQPTGYQPNGQLQPVAVMPQQPKRHMNIFVLILLVYVGLQVVVGVGLMILGRVSR